MLDISIREFCISVVHAVTRILFYSGVGGGARLGHDVFTVLLDMF